MTYRCGLRSSPGRQGTASPVGACAVVHAHRQERLFLPIDVNRDLVLIGLTGQAGLLLAVSPKLGVNSLAELIALAKKDPHTIVIGTNPAGSLPHLAARLLVELSKAPFTVLAYATGGTNEAIRDILGGRVHAVIESRSGLKGALDSGDLKALAIMSGERHEKFPDLPAAAETVPGLTAVGFQARVAPKGTPEAIIDQLREDLRKALQDPHIQTRFEQFGSSFRPMPAADLIRFHVIARAGASFASLGLSSRCRAVAGHFFVSVPEGGDAYLLKSILHDWDDKASVDILRVCRKAMKPTSRLLVVEHVIGPPNTGPEGKFADPPHAGFDWRTRAHA